MKNIFSSSLLLFISIFIYSQNNIVNHGNFEEAIDTTSNIAITPTPSRHSVNLELGGKSVFYSCEYENIFFQKRNIQLSCAVGIEIIPSGFNIHTLGIPLTLNCIIGKKKTFLYAFLGGLNVFTTEPVPSSKSDRIKIRQKDPLYQGSDFIPIYRVFPYSGIGLQVNLRKYFFRVYSNVFLYNVYVTATYTNRYLIVPYGGILLGRKI